MNSFGLGASGPGTALYYDAMQVRKMDPMQLYRSGPKKPSSTSGTPYPCKQSDLDQLNRRMPETLFPPFQSMRSREAVREIESFLDKSKEVSAAEDSAAKRIAEALKLERWGPDLIIKMFGDLDTLFFMGRLKGSVSVEWMQRQEFSNRLGGVPAYGVTSYRGNGTSQITLNAWDILAGSGGWDPFSYMWMTMVHEMVVSLSPFCEHLLL